MGVTAHEPMQLKVRIPGWADRATLNGQPTKNGTFAVVRCNVGNTTATLELKPEIRLEYGWGEFGNSTVPATDGVGVTRGALLFALHPQENRKVTKTYTNDAPVRPRAVDTEIGTNDTWNYGLVPGNSFGFVATPSAGWGTDFAFNDGGEYPFYISAKARQVQSWGYWEGSMITAVPPPSPIKCASSSDCGDETELKLVPFGSTNIRISVFPWIGSVGQQALY